MARLTEALRRRGEHEASRPGHDQRADHAEGLTGRGGQVRDACPQQSRGQVAPVTVGEDH
jgi:hypothetical protein